MVKSIQLAVVLFLIVCCSGYVCAEEGAEEGAGGAAKKRAQPRDVDLALCLDTSGSMEGLINGARDKLWKVVAELGRARPAPRLRVALLTYGGPDHASTGHVIVRQDFTEDLDTLSETLFALRTKGGTEYVGRVLHYALRDLSWSDSSLSDSGGALRIVFVAGNESADQDQERPFRKVVAEAVKREVRVNAIYCGGADDEIAAGWREVAALGKGKFAAIDHNHGTIEVATPFDKELAELSRQLNGTYLFYGADRKAKKSRQEEVDKSASKAGAGIAAERAAAKAGALYRKRDDLVDDAREKGFDLGRIAEKDLPDELKKLDPEARKAHLDKKAKERTALQTKIKELSAKRAAHIQKEMQTRGLDDSKALDRVLRDTIRDQAKDAGFEFDK